MFSGVYRPNDDSCWRFLWKELAGVYVWWNLPWCNCGDFNVTCFTSECSGLSGIKGAMVEFPDFIVDNDLLDIPMLGGLFTWSNNRSSHTWSRIDRFLFSSS